MKDFIKALLIVSLLIYGLNLLTSVHLGFVFIGVLCILFGIFFFCQEIIPIFKWIKKQLK